MNLFDTKSFNPQITEQELIEYVRQPLKEIGFKKKNKRWIKTNDEFTQIFLIQGSCFDKDCYYVRPGIFLNHVERGYLYYGHIWAEINVCNAEQVLKDAITFFKDYTDKRQLKQKVQDFADWDKRNPLEKRRTIGIDYEKDPPPDNHFWQMPQEAIQYVLENY